MNANELFMLAVLATTAGGSIGAKLARIPVWQGAITGALVSLVTGALFAFANIENGLLLYIASMLVALAAGVAFKMKKQQLISVFLGAFLARIFFVIMFTS